MTQPTYSLIRSLAHRFASYTLQTKLIAVFIIITLLAVGTIAFWAERAIRTALIEEVGSDLKGQAGTKALAVGDLLARQIDVLQTLGSSRDIPIEIERFNANFGYTGDQAAIQAQLERLDQQWRAADDADMLIYSRLTTQLAAELKKFRATFPDHVELFITNQYGALVAATNRTSDYYQADEAWWQAAYNNGQGAIYINNIPELDQSSAAFGINIAMPIYGPQNKTVIGILRTTYRLTPLANFLYSTALGSTSHSHLLLPSNQFLSSDAGSITPIGQVEADQLLALANTTYGEFTFEDEPSLVSQAPVSAITGEPAIADLGWQVIAHQNLAEALAPVETQTRTMLIISLAVLIVVAGLALVLGRWLVNPITRLTAVAQQIAAGDLEAQAQVETRDEIGQLAQAFNTMTAQLRSLIDSLEDQVHERTSELTLSLEVGQRASAIRDLEELLPAITELIRERFDLYYTQVYLVDDLEQSVVLKAGTGGVGEALLARHHKIPIGEGSIVGWVAATGKAVVVPNTENSDIHKPNPLLPDTRSELAVPLIVKGQVIGVLDMQAARPNTFILSSVTVFEAMATQLANSIDSAQQFALAQAAQRKAEEAVQQFTRQSWAEKLATRKGGFGFMYNLSTITPLPPPQTHEASQSLPAIKSLVAPLVVQNQPVGRLAVTAPANKNWSDEEQAFVNGVAQQLAQKAENLRLFEQTQQRAAREQLARQISDKVRASRDIDGALKTAAEELTKALGAARAVVNLQVAPNETPANNPDNS